MIVKIAELYNEFGACIALRFLQWSDNHLPAFEDDSVETSIVSDTDIREHRVVDLTVEEAELQPNLEVKVLNGRVVQFFKEVGLRTAIIRADNTVVGDTIIAVCHSDTGGKLNDTHYWVVDCWGKIAKVTEKQLIRAEEGGLYVNFMHATSSVALCSLNYAVDWYRKKYNELAAYLQLFGGTLSYGEFNGKVVLSVTTDRMIVPEGVEQVSVHSSSKCRELVCSEKCDLFVDSHTVRRLRCPKVCEFCEVESEVLDELVPPQRVDGVFRLDLVHLSKGVSCIDQSEWVNLRRSEIKITGSNGLKSLSLRSSEEESVLELGDSPFLETITVCGHSVDESIFIIVSSAARLSRIVVLGKVGVIYVNVGTTSSTDSLVIRVEGSGFVRALNGTIMENSGAVVWVVNSKTVKTSNIMSGYSTVRTITTGDIDCTNDAVQDAIQYFLSRSESGRVVI